MLHIHSNLDKALTDEPWVPLLDPFWGPSQSEAYQKPPFAGRLNRYRTLADSLFKLTSIQQAQLLLFPYGWEVCQRPEGRAVMNAWIEISKACGLPLVVFEHGDLNHVLPDAVSFSFHQSLHRSHRYPGVDIMPPLIFDPLEGSGRTWAAQPYTERPTVSFRGVSPPLGLPVGSLRLKESLRYLAYFSGLLRSHSPKVGYAPRTAAIRALSRESHLNFRCKLLPVSPVQWCCGYMVEGKDERVSDSLRQDYLNDIWSSDYVLCVRGQGNYSLRLYETLAMGRIPIVVDTDLILPFEEQIDWKNLVVWIDEREVPKMARHILLFHKKLGVEGFQQRQFEMRQIWEKWIEPAAFFEKWAEKLSDDLRGTD